MPDNILVTGRWGETHVTSAQAGNFNSGIVGDGCYVMSGLDATMTNANTCHISPGFGSFNGRDFEVPAGGIDLTIDNGTQAQYRNDLVVVRYALEPSSQTESAELVVVKGAPAASEPADPAINEGSILDGDSPVDMPLYRVPLDGISVSDPEPLFDVAPSLADLRDSVSHVAFGVASGTNPDGVAVANIQPPKGFEDRKPDVVLCTLGPMGMDQEFQAMMFTPVLWSIDLPTRAQIRVRREDTHEWAANQGIYVSWMAAWLPG